MLITTAVAFISLALGSASPAPIVLSWQTQGGNRQTIQLTTHKDLQAPSFETLNIEASINEDNPLQPAADYPAVNFTLQQ